MDARRASRPRSWFAPVLVAALVAVLVAAPGAAVADVTAGAVRLEGPVADGAYLVDEQIGPVRVVRVEVAPDAPLHLQPVLSADRINWGREPVSSMCARAHGAVCVNANFPVCPECIHPFGAVVSDGEVWRSPSPLQNQVSLIDGRLTNDPLVWSAGLWVSGTPPGVDDRLFFDSINGGPFADGITISTFRYGTHTGAPAGSYELVIHAPEPLRTGPGARQPVSFVRVVTDGSAAIPEDGAVITGMGAGADALRSFVETHDGSGVELVVNTPAGLQMSIGGHPVLLRDGVPQALDPADGKVSYRHPRTLIAWNDTGALWVVTVDGRQRHSVGMTLPEATDYLRSLGATDAVNLDGGGSSTLVTACPSPSGVCVRNSPSGGAERRVWVALALVPAATPDVPLTPTTTTTSTTTTSTTTTTTTTTPPTPSTTWVLPERSAPLPPVPTSAPPSWVPGVPPPDGSVIGTDIGTRSRWGLAADAGTRTVGVALLAVAGLAGGMALGLFRRWRRTVRRG